MRLRLRIGPVWISPVLKILTATVLGSFALLTVGAYLFLPWPGLRTFSGPPPLFAFNSSHGTGFFIDDSGHLLTNRHVVKACRRITVAGNEFRATPARIIGISSDPAIDLALLQVSIRPSSHISVSDNASPAPGHAGLRMFGFPGDNFSATPSRQWVPPAMSVSTTDRRNWFPRIHGTFRQGSSGSPLIDDTGHLFGVLFAMVMTVDVSSPAASDQKQTQPHWNGPEGHEALVIPAAAIGNFIRASGLQGASAVPGQGDPDPSLAVARIFCFQNS